MKNNTPVNPLKSPFSLMLVSLSLAALVGLSGCARTSQNAQQQEPTLAPGHSTPAVPAEQAGQSNNAQRSTYGGGELKPYETGTGKTADTTGTPQGESMPSAQETQTTQAPKQP